jgi:hypothetical protein
VLSSEKSSYQKAEDVLPSIGVESVDSIYLDRELVDVKEIRPTWVNLDGSGMVGFASPQEAQKIAGVKVITVEDREYPRLIARGFAKGTAVVIRPRSIEDTDLEIVPEKIV